MCMINKCFQVPLLFVLGFLSVFFIARFIIKYKESSNSYQTWYKSFSRIVRLLFFSICFSSFFIVFALNVFYLYAPIKVESTLGENEAFAIIIALLTLCATIIIAILQFLNQRSQLLINARNTHKNEIINLLKHVQNSGNLFVFRYKRLKEIYYRDFYDGFEKNYNVTNPIEYLIELSFSTSLSLFDFTFEKDLKSKVPYNNIIVDEDKLYIYFDDRNTLDSFVLSFLCSERKDSIDLYIIVKKNENNINMRLKIQLQILSLHSKTQLFDIDGVCELKVVGLFLEDY